MKKVLAIDMGATSIRGILGSVESGHLVTEEVLRFTHRIVDKDGRSRWEFQKIMDNIVLTIKKHKDEISSIGIDTWGVDFGILDKQGRLILPPVSYRDEKHSLGLDLALDKSSHKEIFMHTGNQIMSINSLFQLLALEKVENEAFKKMDKLLFMPDLINYFLTGHMACERTIASTSQLYDIKEKKFSKHILDTFGLKEGLFSELVEAGTVVGSTKDSIISDLREVDIPVISVASHDTASAVLLTEAFEDTDTLFLSCGTWSLLGAFTDKAIIDEAVFESSLTNEEGYGAKNMFFKNINGLYLVERLKNQLEGKYHRKIDFDEISDYVRNARGESLIIDVEDEAFNLPDFDMIKNINSFLELENSLEDFYYFKIIYESLAYKYNDTIKRLEGILGKKFNKIHMIGGGCKSTLLCELIQRFTNLELVAGPLEATAYGNILVQLKALDEISSIGEGLKLVNNSIELKKYTGGRYEIS